MKSMPKLNLFSNWVPIVFSLQNANLLSGTLVPEIVYLTELTLFEASGMQVTGSIGGQFSNASNLEALMLNNNRMTGSIPDNFVLENGALTTLQLSGNKLIGTIPSSLSTLTNLRKCQCELIYD